MSEPALSMIVCPVPGADINDCFEQAARTAKTLELAWASFDFNDDDCAAYPDGRGLVIRGSREIGTWTREKGIQWR